jgi:hypothetical protein
MTPHRTARRLTLSALGATALLATSAASAWTDHALATRQALSVLPAAAQAAAVAAEPLDAFVQADAARLEQVLGAEEAWAREHVPHYPPRPDALAFSLRSRATPCRASSLRCASIRTRRCRFSFRSCRVRAHRAHRFRGRP